MAYGKQYGVGFGKGVVGKGLHGKGLIAKGVHGHLGGAAYGQKHAAQHYGGQALVADAQASDAAAAALSAQDADAFAKQAYGSDYDSRWGKSYDFVNANEYDDEQYARKVRADDDQWAEDYDVWSVRDNNAYKGAASKEAAQPKIVATTYQPVVSHKSYGYGKGHGVGFGHRGYGGYGGYGAGIGNGYRW